MITTTRDMFSIAGARETAKEVALIYESYGKSENFGMVEDDAPHESTKKNREAMYSFFQKHFRNPGSSDDEDVDRLTEDELRVTSTGQVATSLGGETVFSLNLKQAHQRIENLENARKNPAYLSEAVKAAQELSGYRAPKDIGMPVFNGRIQRDGYAIEKYFLRGEGDYVIPYLLMVPDDPSGKGILYLHPEGKGAQASADGEMSSFVKRGFTVLAPDLPGTGELGPGDLRGDAFIGGISHNIWYASILIGRSIVGVQAGDIARLIEAFEKNHETKEIYGVARKEMTPVLLHAAAFIPSIKRVALIDPLISYRLLVTNRFYHSGFIAAAVAAAITAYDLPDLAAALAPRKLLYANVTSDTTEMKEMEDAETDFQFVRQAYQQKGKDQLQIFRKVPEADLAGLLAKWSR